MRSRNIGIVEYWNNVFSRKKLSSVIRLFMNFFHIIPSFHCSIIPGLSFGGLE
jgi:hypothetical protein